MPWQTVRVFTTNQNIPDARGSPTHEYRHLDSGNHTCPMHTAKPNEVITIGGCEGCVAESYLLDWLTKNVLGLCAVVQGLEAGKVDR